MKCICELIDDKNIVIVWKIRITGMLCNSQKASKKASADSDVDEEEMHDREIDLLRQQAKERQELLKQPDDDDELSEVRWSNNVMDDQLALYFIVLFWRQAFSCQPWSYD